MTTTYYGIPFGLETFHPTPDDTIVVHIDTDICSLDIASKYILMLEQMYPENKIIGLLKGIGITIGEEVDNT